LSKLKPVKEVHTLMGCDISTKSFAFCIVRDGSPIRWGELHFAGKTSFERLHDASEKLQAMADFFAVDMIVVESSVLIQNKKTVIQLSHAIGTVIPAIMQYGTMVEEMSPVEWQRLIGNPPLTKAEKDAIKQEHPGRIASWYSEHGRALRKERTKDWVVNTLGEMKKSDSDNVTDAVGVAVAGWDKFVRKANV
jgi:Holliday junction resolvasome RuvABC endonuclease subunit